MSTENVSSVLSTGHRLTINRGTGNALENIVSFGAARLEMGHADRWPRTGIGMYPKDSSVGQTSCSSSPFTVRSKSCDGEAALPQLNSMGEHRHVAEDL